MCRHIFAISVMISCLSHALILWGAGYYWTLKSSIWSGPSLPLGNHTTVDVSFITKSFTTQPPDIAIDREQMSYPVMQKKIQPRSPKKGNFIKNTFQKNEVQKNSSLLSSPIRQLADYWVPCNDNPSPHYPEEERLNEREALCMMKLYINHLGDVCDVEPIRTGHQNCTLSFLDSAKKALKNWKFISRAPSKIINGENKIFFKILPIKFKIQD